MGPFTQTPEYVYIIDSRTKYFVSGQQYIGKPLLPFHDKTQRFYIAEIHI